MLPGFAKVAAGNMAFLYQLNADGTPAKHWVVGETPLVVGREQPADACVDDDALSQTHFLIVREATEFFLVDLNSSNGTQVNDGPVSAHKLHTGEFISAGNSVFCFRLTPMPGEAPIRVHLLDPSLRPSARPGH
jgi:pSer/pThr/pTyr-binding forkhead associated (FHA) protein